MFWFEVLVAALCVILGIAALATGQWMASRTSLSMFRRAVRVLMLCVVFFVVFEVSALLRAFGVSNPALAAGGSVAEILIAVCLGVAVYVLYRSEREEISDLLRLANIDELTALANRAFFRRAAERRFALSRRHDLPLSCLVLDIDDFKLYNDLHGHEAGDDALRCVAKALRAESRGDDLVARYGGEEFMVLMNGDRESAVVAAERIRLAVEHSCSPAASQRLHRQITVSVGVYTLNEDTATLQDLISRADEEMYQAKRAGKNRISVPG